MENKQTRISRQEEEKTDFLLPLRLIGHHNLENVGSVGFVFDVNSKKCNIGSVGFDVNSKKCFCWERVAADTSSLLCKEMDSVWSP
jgi:hypothetical protein